MPQMAPTLWLPMSMTLFFTILTLMTMIYFFKEKKNYNMTKKSYFNKQLTWKW